MGRGRKGGKGTDSTLGKSCLSAWIDAEGILEGKEGKNRGKFTKRSGVECPFNRVGVKFRG